MLNNTNNWVADFKNSDLLKSRSEEERDDAGYNAELFFDYAVRYDEEPEEWTIY